MTVYFVNRYAKLKGPFDITDPNREHIIKVGDICLRDTTGGVEFLFVITESNSWNACKCIGLGDNAELISKGNSLLLSFDGIHGRKGNLSFLYQLTSCFGERVINDFLENAIDILEYKRDSWDGSLFPRFFADNHEIVNVKKELKPSVQPKSESYPSDFCRYLDDRLLDSLKNYIEEGVSLKDAYMLIREDDPKSFRKALMKFLIENPNGTIFDKAVETEEPVKPAPKPDTKADIKEPEKVIIQHEKQVDVFRRFLLNDYDDKEFKKLLKEYRKGDNKAFDKIVGANTKLVAAIAESYKDHGVEYKDLVQEGTIGLIRAIKRFDPRRKVQFPAYARWWIHQSLIHALGSIQSSIKLPENQISLYKKVRKSIDRYEQEHGYKPSSSEIEIEGYDDSQNIEFLSKLPENLDELTVNSADLDALPDDELAADDVLMKESQTYFIETVLGKLSPREALILRLKYGIGEKIESLSEIGARFGLTRERARQISERAVRKLREIVGLRRRNDEEDDEITSDKDNTNASTISSKDNAPVNVKLNKKKADKPKNKGVTFAHENAIMARNVIKLLGYTIVNTDYSCDIYDTKRNCLFHSEGNIKPIGNLLYLVRRTDKHFAVYRIDARESKLSMGNILVLADKNSLLYSKLNEKACYNQIENITKDYSKNTCRISVGGEIFDEKGHSVLDPRLKIKVRSLEEPAKKSDNILKEGAKVGDELLYNSKKCVVIEKKTRNGSNRLVVKYDNGTIDDVTDKKDNYSILRKPLKQKVEQKDDCPLPTRGAKRIDTAKLNGVFANKTTSYKYFWFMAIISLAKERSTLSLSLRTILIRMAAISWGIVLRREVLLGNQDRLKKYLNEIVRKTSLDKYSSEKYVEEYLNEHYHDMEIDRILEPLLNNVPYRFLSPWVKYKTDRIVIEKSQDPSFDGPYAIYKRKIVLNYDWKEYFVLNYSQVCAFTIKGFKSYALHYNTEAYIDLLKDGDWYILSNTK